MHIVIYKCACLVIRLCDINHLEKTMTQIPKWTGGPGPDDRDPESSRHYSPHYSPLLTLFTLNHPTVTVTRNPNRKNSDFIPAQNNAQ